MFAANANGFSVSRLHGALTSSGWRVAKATLLPYLDHLVDSFLVFLVPIRTRSARQRAVNPRKKTREGLEVDFAVDDPVRGGPPALIQVCASVDEPSTRARELEALQCAMAETGSQDATVVTMSQEASVQTPHGFIHVVPARAFFFSATPEMG